MMIDGIDGIGLIDEGSLLLFNIILIFMVTNCSVVSLLCIGSFESGRLRFSCALTVIRVCCVIIVFIFD